jgi:hypothetical protein
MCYSAQVIQAVRKMYRQLGIRLDYDEAERLFFRRMDDPTINISRGFEANFDDPTTDQGWRIKSAIDEHRSRVAGKIEKDLFTQKTRLVGKARARGAAGDSVGSCCLDIRTRHIEGRVELTACH